MLHIYISGLLKMKKWLGTSNFGGQVAAATLSKARRAEDTRRGPQGRGCGGWGPGEGVSPSPG